MALGSWSAADDPTVRGSLRLRCEALLAYGERAAAAGEVRVTPTALVARCFAQALREVPDCGAIWRGGRIYLRQDVTLFVHVALTDPRSGRLDLSGVTLHHADRATVIALARRLDGGVREMRGGQGAVARTRELFRWLPQPVVGPLLTGLSFVTHTLNLDLSVLCVPRDPFGGAALTNVGAPGLDTACVPLVPYTRIPLFVAMGAVVDEPVVEGGAVVPARVLPLHATFDHRLMDGAHLARFVAVLRRCFADADAALGPAEAE